jgi:hypothetical protein
MATKEELAAELMARIAAKVAVERQSFANLERLRVRVAELEAILAQGPDEAAEAELDRVTDELQLARENRGASMRPARDAVQTVEREYRELLIEEHTPGYEAMTTEQLEQEARALDLQRHELYARFVADRRILDRRATAAASAASAPVATEPTRRRVR